MSDEEFKTKVISNLEKLNLRMDRHEMKTNVIYTSLVGNTLGNEGIIKRVEKTENYIQSDKKIKWMGAGILATISWIFSHLGK